jgi:hypothetical protein
MRLTRHCAMKCSPKCAQQGTFSVSPTSKQDFCCRHAGAQRAAQTAPSCRVHCPARSQSCRDAHAFPRSPSEHCICDLHARYRTHDMLCKHVVRQNRFFRHTDASPFASSSSRSSASSFRERYAPPIFVCCVLRRNMLPGLSACMRRNIHMKHFPRPPL